MTPNPPHSIEAEERFEIQRHNELYDRQRPQELGIMTPWDWERFDQILERTDPYIESVRRLGDLRGKRVFDVGCGSGWLSIILAKRGALVDGMDISPEAVRTAELRSARNGVGDQCRFRAGSCYELPYEDGRFEVVAGQSILHHVGDKARAAAELFRVMRPSAHAVFHEPFGNSLMMERLRRLVPVPSGSPDDPEQWSHQFKYSDLPPFRAHFEVEIEEFQFFSRLDRVIRSPKVRLALGRFDRALLAKVGFLRQYARAIVIVLRKPPAR
ncbi:MAG: class I SAM-dependent methyltransferase [Gemmatimonadales bacterium]|nr:class I SAM-dependent methyltransferase [Gemmatimonadales bacterium]